MLCFCAYFSLQTLQFLLVGVQKYFLPRGAEYLCHTTDHALSSLITSQQLSSAVAQLGYHAPWDKKYSCAPNQQKLQSEK